MRRRGVWPLGDRVELVVSSSLCDSWMGEKMDDSDLALEQAIIKIDSGDDLSSGSDRESETPAPGVRRVSAADGETAAGILEEDAFREETERTLDEGGSGGGSSGGGEPQETRTLQTQPCISRAQVTLYRVFQDYKLFILFQRFLKDQCIQRNLKFWLACKHYHELPGGAPEAQERLYTAALAIYGKYIKMSAPQLVQVKASTKRIIKSILELNPKTLSPLLYKPAQDEVWCLMQQNELRQFLASDVFGEVYGGIGDDTISLDMAYTPVGGALHGASPMLHQSSSEDSVSVTSCSTE